MPEPENNPPELVLEEVVEVSPEELSEDQTTYLRENVDDLTDEQKVTFKEVLEEEEEEIDLDKVKPESRVPKKKKPAEPTEPEDDDDETAPEDKAVIDKRVDQRVKPLEEKIDAQAKRAQKLADEGEVDAFIRGKPEFAKYRGVALKYMGHSAYSNIPVHNIMAIVAKEDLQKMGAKKERDARKKTDDTKSPGGSVRKPGEGKIDWSKASKEEVEAHRAKVLGQQG